MRILSLFLIVVLPASAVSSEFYQGENLLTPYDLESERWEILKKEEGQGMLWRSKEKGMADAYAVTIYRDHKEKLSDVRNTQDAPAKKSCESFESINLDPIPDRNYDSLLWRTVCTKGDDFKAQILHLVIQGKDSLYHLQKIWRGNVPVPELDEWIEQFRKVYVCDTRERKKQCPSGYEKVKDI